MLVVCGICTEIFVPATEVYITHCGHLFHNHCLLQWIESSETCPQCRTETNERSMHQVYFNVQNSEGTSDQGEMQNKIDDLNLQLRCRDIQITQHREEIEVLAKQNEEIRQVSATLQAKLKEKDLKISNVVNRYKEIIRRNEEAYDDMCKKQREEVLSFQKKLETSVQKNLKLTGHLQTFSNELTTAKHERSILFEQLKTKQERVRKVNEGAKRISQLESKIKTLERRLIAPFAPRVCKKRVLQEQSPLTPQVCKKRVLQEQSRPVNVKCPSIWTTFETILSSPCPSQPSTSRGTQGSLSVNGLDDLSSDPDDLGTAHTVGNVQEEETQTPNISINHLLLPVKMEDNGDYNDSDAETEVLMGDNEVGNDEEPSENEADEDEVCLGGSDPEEDEVCIAGSEASDVE